MQYPVIDRMEKNMKEHKYVWSLPGGSDSAESACSVRDPGSIPGLVRPPEEGTGNPLQYSCLENSIDRGSWRTTVYGVTESQTRLSD